MKIHRPHHFWTNTSNLTTVVKSVLKYMINGTLSILKSKIFQICAAIYQFLLHMVFTSRNWFGNSCHNSTKLSEVNVKNILTSHIDKKIFLTFLFLTTYLYTFSLYANPSFIIFSAETEYISTRSWYRNINFSLVLLWQLFYLFCSSIVINTVIVTAGNFEP
jgi:hypothetical protein